VCAKWMPWLAYQANTDGGSAADPAVAGEGPALREDVGEVVDPVAVPQAAASRSASAAAPTRPVRCRRRAVPARALVTGTSAARTRLCDVGGLIGADASSACGGHTVTQSSGFCRLSTGRGQGASHAEKPCLEIIQGPPPTRRSSVRCSRPATGCPPAATRPVLVSHRHWRCAARRRPPRRRSLVPRLLRCVSVRRHGGGASSACDSCAPAAARSAGHIDHQSICTPWIVISGREHLPADLLRGAGWLHRR